MSPISGGTFLFGIEENNIHVVQIECFLVEALLTIFLFVQLYSDFQKEHKFWILAQVLNISSSSYMII